ncbi:MAG: TPM domain-containing protein [Acidobacteria bacterium]|nr:TPM domain-containing protein [Acidobacteriota bacterium]
MSKWWRLCALLAFAHGIAAAVDWKALKPQGYVSDFAGVVDPASRAQLERYAAATERATGAQMAFVTVATLEGEPIEDVANTIFRAWGVGRKGKDEGALVLLVVADRRMRMEVGYGLEPIIPDGFAGSVLRQMRPALRAGRYGEALMAAAQTIGGRIAQAKGVTIGAPSLRYEKPAPVESVPWVWLVLAGFLLVWFLGARRRGAVASGGGGFLPGFLLGDIAGRATWGGRSGGGFGGYDSGDSFGGFGGGDSGGGGASSDW